MDVKIQKNWIMTINLMDNWLQNISPRYGKSPLNKHEHIKFKMWRQIIRQRVTQWQMISIKSPITCLGRWQAHKKSHISQTQIISLMLLLHKYCMFAHTRITKKTWWPLQNQYNTWWSGIAFHFNMNTKTDCSHDREKKTKQNQQTVSCSVTYGLSPLIILLLLYHLSLLLSRGTRPIL